jgi:hypothetical protein
MKNEDLGQDELCISQKILNHIIEIILTLRSIILMDNILENYIRASPAARRKRTWSDRLCPP